MKYSAIRGNNIQIHTIIAAVVGGAGMIYIGLNSDNKLAILVGVILFATLLIRRPVEVTEEGLVQITDFRLFMNKEVWKFNQMNEIHWMYEDEIKEIKIYFEKMGIPKMYRFKLQDAEAILKLAADKNKNLVIKEVKKSDLE